MPLRTMFGLCFCAGCLVACDVSKGALEGMSEALRQTHPNIRKSKDSVARQLKDPASAQFRDLIVYADGVVCGEFNAKNSLGGYVGFRRFVYRPMGTTGVMAAYFDQSEDDVTKWCNDTPNKVLTDLANAYAKADGVCQKELAAVSGRTLQNALQGAYGLGTMYDCQRAIAAQKALADFKAGRQ